MTPALVLVFCLASAPTVCQEQRPPMDELPPNACVGIEPQILAIHWLDDHPAWTYRKAYCETRKKERAT